jgi:DNA-binding NtrC family response regulator
MDIRLLILDTPKGHLENLVEAFKAATNQKCRIDRMTSANELLNKLQSGLRWDLLVVDYHLGDGELSGKKLIDAIRANNPITPLVVVAEFGDVSIASEAIKAGANDFLVRTGNLTERVRTLLKKIPPHLKLISSNRMLRERNKLLQERAKWRFQVIGESPQINAVLEKIEKVAKIPRPVLITGERGTGKELVAHALHAYAKSSNQPLVAVNCAAFSDSLLETELFGHEKGAYTGADSQSYGKFELANEGTLFLDEIGNMSLAFQQKIIRVVEYGSFTRVGGSKEIQVNTRIVAATNVDILKRMEEGKFLHDLYDRLSFEIIDIPPLRAREGDIKLLAGYFLNQFMKEIPSLNGKRLGKSALDVLEKYSFPGNVRELKNIIERAAYQDTTDEITPEDIGMLPDKPMDITKGSFYEMVEAYKERIIINALQASGNNQAKAARSLGLSYHQYRYFLKKYTTALSS